MVNEGDMACTVGPLAECVSGDYKGENHRGGKERVGIQLYPERKRDPNIA